MLEGIKNNIEKLIALYEAEKSENESLRRELLQVKAENEVRGKRIEDLEQHLNNLHLSEAFRVGGDTSAAKEKIERLIKEIDKCIALLENQEWDKTSK